MAFLFVCLHQDILETHGAVIAPSRITNIKVVKKTILLLNQHKYIEHITGHLLRDRKDRKKSHPFIELNRYSFLHICFKEK